MPDEEKTPEARPEHPTPLRGRDDVLSLPNADFLSVAALYHLWPTP